MYPSLSDLPHHLRVKWPAKSTMRLMLVIMMMMFLVLAMGPDFEFTPDAVDVAVTRLPMDNKDLWCKIRKLLIRGGLFFGTMFLVWLKNYKISNN